MSWTEERIERLKKMWHDGATASQIAEELGGVSRNAVIGKAHRLGLEQRPSPVKAGEEKEAQEARRRRAARAGYRQGRAQARRVRARARPRAAPARMPRRRRNPPRPRPSCNIARSAPAVSSARVRAISRRRSRRRRRAAWCRPSRAPRSPTRPACSISTTAFANGRSAIPASPTSTSVATPANPGFPYCVEHCGVAYQAQLPRRDRRPPPPLPFGGPRVR